MIDYLKIYIYFCFNLITSRYIFAVCEYFVHGDCQDFAVADCKENATYIPGKDLSLVHHEHHWREGNLPSNSKCVMCKKTCWSAECLAGFRCEWCGMSVSSEFYSLLKLELGCVNRKVIFLGMRI